MMSSGMRFCRATGWWMVLACLICVPCRLEAQGADELSWAEKMFDKRSHDFGVLARGAEARHRFKVTNLYRETVQIADVRTTCGCSAARPSQKTLKSREVAYIEVSMDTRRFVRRKNSNLVVTFSAPLHAEVRIPISAYIRTDVVLTPGSVDFGSVDRGEEAETTIHIAYAGRPDWTIKGVRVKNEYLTARVVEDGRQNGRVDYTLHVSLKPTAPVGRLNDQIALITDDKNSPLVPVLVQARVEPDITVTPSAVSLGRLRPGEEKTVNVVLRGKEPFAVEAVKCQSGSENFSARLSDETRPVHVVPLKFTAPEAPGPVDEELALVVAGRPEPLVLQAHGQVVQAEDR